MEESEKEKLETSKELIPADLELAKQVDPKRCSYWRGCFVSEARISFKCPMQKCGTQHELQLNLFSSQSEDARRGLLSTGRTKTFDSRLFGKLSTVVAVIVVVAIGSFIGLLLGSPPLVYAIIAVLLLPALKPICAALLSRVDPGKQMPVWLFKCTTCGHRLLIATDMNEAYIADIQADATDGKPKATKTLPGSEREQDRQVRAAPEDIRDETPPAESPEEAAKVKETVRRSRAPVRLTFVLVSAGLATGLVAATAIYYTRKPSSHSVPATGGRYWEGDDKDLAISILSQEWKALPKGTKFKSPSGHPCAIANDLAGVTVVVRMRNRTALDILVESPIMLAGRQGSPITTLGLVKSGDKALTRWPDGGLEVPAHGHVVLELQSTFETYKELSRARPLAIELPNHDTRADLEALPSWKALCQKLGNREGAIDFPFQVSRRQIVPQ
ncbi:MAG: hypothetical protein JSW27_03850 [Phycisphaerales bacterium]|nr:MAG: hypothetical protein JSW27_03850 [Phycisphaerales bacterium]